MHELNTYFLQRNYIAQLNKIIAALIDYNQFPYAENLHRIRVAIKKIKAICALSTFVLDEHYAIPALNQLFKNAGELRELQIQIQFLNRISKNHDSCGIALSKNLKLREKIFSKTIHVHVNKLHHLRNICIFPSHLIDQKSLKTYFNLQHQIAKQLYKSHKKKRLHQLRKTIKKTLYLYGFLPMEIQQEMPIDLKNMSVIQSALGDWHDWYVAKKYFSRKSSFYLFYDCSLKLKNQEKLAYKKLTQKLAVIENI